MVTPNKATITRKGTVLLGKYVACDGFQLDRSVGVITHIHEDHTAGFHSSLQFYEPILVTQETKDLLVALEGEALLLRRNLRAIPLRKAFDYKEERITLFPAKHMLGSAQVLVEDVKGTRIVNTGDFMMPNTPTLQPDILVMEATYGDPSHVRFYDRQLITEKFISLVKERVKQEPVYIFSRQGRLQHLMNLLIEADVDVPFLAPEKIFIVAQVYERYGLKVGDCLQLKGEEANEVLKSGQPYIAFHSIGSEKRIKELEKFLSIHVSQYATDESFAETRKNHYSVAISDHADFNGLYEYVRESNPKRLIIDSYRCGQAIIFGEEIRKRLNIKVETQPYCLGV